MKLEPQVAEDDFMYSSGGDSEWRTFLVRGYHSEEEWCCDVCNCVDPNGHVSRAWT